MVDSGQMLLQKLCSLIKLKSFKNNQFLFKLLCSNFLLSDDLTNRLLALNCLGFLIANCSYNATLTNSVLISSKEFFNAIESCLLDVCDPNDEPGFSAREMLRIAGLELLVNLSFFSDKCLNIMPSHIYRNIWYLSFIRL
ncbi:MAG: hypothetical protein MHPSP_000459 [Paramarteilia canceri]